MRLTKAIRCASFGLVVAAFVAAMGAMPASAADSIQTFKNDGTQRCMDDTFAGGLRTWPCNGTAAQQWRVHVWGDGTRRLQSIGTTWCVIHADGYLHMANCDASQEESWWVEPAPGVIPIAFRNQLSGICLDDTNEGGFRMWACNDTAAQHWR